MRTKPQHGGGGEEAAGQGGGEQRLGEAVDRDGEGEAARHQQQVARHAGDTLQFRDGRQQQQQEGRHGAFDDGARGLHVERLERQVVHDERQVPGLEHHEGHARRGEPARHREQRARAEAIEREERQRTSSMETPSSAPRKKDR